MKKCNVLSLTLIFTLSMFTLTIIAEELKTCAVIPFGGMNSSQTKTSEAMCANYEQQINQSGKYKTIENTKDKLLKADYFGKKYTTVTSAAMNAGIILVADYVIYGQITQTGNQYVLTTTLVDINESKPVRSVRSKVEGDIDKIIE